MTCRSNEASSSCIPLLLFAPYYRTRSPVAAGGGGSGRLLVAHAPEMPDFWRGNPYASLFSERRVLDAVDFVSIRAPHGVASLSNPRPPGL